MEREHQDDRVRKQREILEQSLKSLREKRDLTERLRKANLKSAEEANDPEEIKTIEERYHEEVIRIETAIKNAEEQLTLSHETKDMDEEADSPGG
jgi:hypothetical protein